MVRRVRRQAGPQPAGHPAAALGLAAGRQSGDGSRPPARSAAGSRPVLSPPAAAATRASGARSRRRLALPPPEVRREDRHVVLAGRRDVPRRHDEQRLVVDHQLDAGAAAGRASRSSRLPGVAGDVTGRRARRRRPICSATASTSSHPVAAAHDQPGATVACSEASRSRRRLDEEAGPVGPVVSRDRRIASSSTNSGTTRSRRAAARERRVVVDPQVAGEHGDGDGRASDGRHSRPSCPRPGPPDARASRLQPVSVWRALPASQSVQDTFQSV